MPIRPLHNAGTCASVPNVGPGAQGSKVETRSGPSELLGVSIPKSEVRALINPVPPALLELEKLRGQPTAQTGIRQWLRQNLGQLAVFLGFGPDMGPRGEKISTFDDLVNVYMLHLGRVSKCYNVPLRALLLTLQKEYVPDDGRSSSDFEKMATHEMRVFVTRQLERILSVVMVRLVKPNGFSMTEANIKAIPNLTRGVIERIQDVELRDELLRAYDKNDPNPMAPGDNGYVRSRQLQAAVEKGEGPSLLRTLEVMAVLMQGYQEMVDQYEQLPLEDRRGILKNFAGNKEEEELGSLRTVRFLNLIYSRGPRYLQTRAIQWELVKKGFLKPDDVDGYSGDKTISAMREAKKQGQFIAPKVTVPPHMWQNGHQLLL